MVDARKIRALGVMNAIREILFVEWDPIGVNENQQLNDEYDSYIAPVYRLISERASAENLAKFLFEAEHELGMPAKSVDTLLPVAKKLLSLEFAPASNAE